MTALGTRADIRARKFRQTRDVDVPEWGGIFRLRAMSANERDAFEASSFVETVTTDAEGKPITTRKVIVERMRARLLARCLVDEGGARLYGDSEEELDELGAEDSGVVARLFAIAAEMNGIGPKAQAAAEKNSVAPSAVSPSA